MPTTLNNASSTLFCSDLVIRAGRRELLSRFNWGHEPGHIAWLFGSNGSGKSSLLRVFAGLRKPTSGVVEWRSHRFDGIVYHSPALQVPPEVRVGAFVEFAERISNQAAPANLLASLYPENVGGDDRFKTLSTGEAKRLMLWAILRRGNCALVLDEPYEHLSRDAKTTLSALLRWYAKEFVVIVATNQDVPLEVGDAVLTFEGSEVEVDHVV